MTVLLSLLKSQLTCVKQIHGSIRQDLLLSCCLLAKVTLLHVLVQKADFLDLFRLGGGGREVGSVMGLMPLKALHNSLAQLPPPPPPAHDH